MASPMNYSEEWNLHSIPVEAIPEDLLKSWWVTRMGMKGGRKIQKVANSKLARIRKERREYMRNYRKKVSEIS